MLVLRIGHLVAINAFVGAMVGMERTVLPLLAEADFGVASRVAILSFIASFGVTKAVVNALAGALADRFGRKRLLVAGWCVGLPVPLMIIGAPAWSWILVANVLLGVNQALTWSMTVVMKVDLAEPRHFGLVIGLNEFAGYAGMAVAAAVTGWLASTYDLRPEPFYLGVILAVLGLLLSAAARDTTPSGDADEPSDRRHDDTTRADVEPGPPSFVTAMARSAWKDAHLSAASVSGMATNLKDGVVWGLLPILLASRDLAIEKIGVVVALYPLVWAFSQLVFGPLSDRLGRRSLIVAGMATQSAGLLLFAGGSGYTAYLSAAFVVGLGTGMVYPTLLAFVSEEAPPSWRATALGAYRFWRDLGYAAGALGGGLLADLLGLPTTLTATAGLAGLAGLVFVIRTRR